MAIFFYMVFIAMKSLVGVLSEHCKYSTQSGERILIIEQDCQTFSRERQKVSQLYILQSNSRVPESYPLRHLIPSNTRQSGEDVSFNYELGHQT